MSIFQDIPESLLKGLDDNLFVQFDSGQKDGDRFIICYNSSHEYLLKSSSTWLADGTFKIASSSFKQLYIIQCMIVNKAFTLAYIFLSGKKEEQYYTAFTKLKSLLNQVSVTDIIVDFERSAINSFKRVFPGVSVHLCLFHWSQAILRNMKSHSIYVLYKEEKPIRALLKELMSLPFLNPTRICRAFKEVKDALLLICPNNRGIVGFLSYFEDTFISNRTNSSYLISEWSTFSRIRNNLFLTTNTCENWNSRASLDFPGRTPDLVSVLMYLRSIDIITKLKIGEKLQSSILNEVKVERKKTIEKKYKFILQLLAKENEFSDRTLLQLLSTAYKHSLE
jgi:MULE transposase domain